VPGSDKRDKTDTAGEARSELALRARQSFRRFLDFSPVFKKKRPETGYCLTVYTTNTTSPQFAVVRRSS
jgi:hypothetical protein